MTPLLALLTVSRPFDGEDAVTAARAFLVRMGVRDLVGLEALVEGDAKRWGWHGDRIWSVGFDLADGNWFSVNVDATGTVFYASRSSHGKEGSVPPAQGNAFARRLMDRVPHAIPVRQDLVRTGTFHAVVDGRIYFNLNPTYGYYLTSDANGGLTWFGRQDVLPPPVTRTPKVARAAAQTTLNSIWKTEDRAPTWPYPRRVQMELGYYHRKDEPTARLVWHGDVYSRTAGVWREFSTIDTFVDAANGATFKADDR